MKNGIPHTFLGRFCQKELIDNTLFLEIHSCEYDRSLLTRYEELGVLEDSLFGSFLRLFSDPIPEGTSYLYKLEAYNADKSIKSAWEFGLSVSNFEAKGFCSIDALLHYCEQKWNITAADFTSQNRTDIP